MVLTICAACKRIRNDGGYWERIETYIRDHSEAEFSHGICPECEKRLYPEELLRRLYPEYTPEAATDADRLGQEAPRPSAGS